MPVSKNGATMLLVENEPAWVPSIFVDDLVKRNYYNTTGDKRYELSNHLGNVLSVVSDKKIPNFTSSSLNYFNADIKSYSDYYPFGMPMPNKTLEGDYRYSFQGQEKDAETEMEAFELRLWDNRIGRWLTTDPAGQYFSPYLGMGNNPINGVDPDGGYWKPNYVNIFGVTIDITALRVAALNGAIDSKISQLGSMSVSTLTAAQQQDITTRVSNLNSMKRRIADIGNNTSFEVSLDPYTNVPGISAFTIPTGVRSVSVPFDLSSVDAIALTIHETYHGYQFISGAAGTINPDLTITVVSNAAVLRNEQQGFQMQYSFEPSSIPTHQRIDFQTPFLFHSTINSINEIDTNFVLRLVNNIGSYLYQPSMPRDKIINPRFF